MKNRQTPHFPHQLKLFLVLTKNIQFLAVLIIATTFHGAYLRRCAGHLSCWLIPYKTTCAVYDSSGTHFLSYFQESSRIDCLLLLKSSGLDLWKSFLQDSASRSHILFGGKSGIAGLEPATTSQFMCTLLYQLSYIPHNRHQTVSTRIYRAMRDTIQF